LDLKLAGLTAVVTGGSAGIGLAIVQALATEGCNVHFCAPNQQGIDTALASCPQLKGKVFGRALDVTDRDAAAKWFETIQAFDIFIPNVSALSGDWNKTIQIDISATIDLTEQAIGYLKQSQFTAITYIGSKAGSLAAPNAASYGAAKAAMAHYMKSLSLRLLPHVRVNVVSPGDTLAADGYWDKVRLNEPDVFAKVVARNPMQRLATADEVAKVVAFVSSPCASFVSGANWYVDGGSIAHVQF
jgi:3-oxoacyl-[acyl-carrier protein] reductase